MEPADLQAAWVRQAQLDAERGVIECRICRQRSGLDRTITVWRDGALVFAVCDECGSNHDVLIRPTDAGLEVRANARRPLVVGALR